MKSQITVRTTPTGYVIEYAGRFGGGGSMPIVKDPVKAAGVLRSLIARYITTNPESGDYFAPDEVLEAMESNTVHAEKGERLSYYASPEAIRAIQAHREATGGSLSGAINALILRQ